MLALVSRTILTVVSLVVCAGAAVAAQKCVDPKHALGVSRVVEIDTTTGPAFGSQHTPHVEFLADKEVVLTFDDGPLRPYTRPVLDALEAECTRATFFLVGRMALSDPAMVREVARRGHTVGSHTWSHQNMRKITPLKARHEIELGFSAVRLALGAQPAPFFRFPYLADTRSMNGIMQSRHMGVFSIDVDSNDYRTKDPALVHQNILSELAERRKGIILFHDIQTSTAQALPALLAILKAKGYRVVHMVPKHRATTLPEFDAIAKEEAGQRQVASLAKPLADRSLTWTMNTRVAAAGSAGGDAYTTQPTARRPSSAAPSPPPVAPFARAPSPPPSPTQQQPGLVATPAPLTPQERAVLRAQIAAQNEWRTRVFGGN